VSGSVSSGHMASFVVRADDGLDGVSDQGDGMGKALVRAVVSGLQRVEVLRQGVRGAVMPGSWYVSLEYPVSLQLGPDVNPCTPWGAQVARRLPCTTTQVPGGTMRCCLNSYDLPYMSCPPTPTWKGRLLSQMMSVACCGYPRSVRIWLDQIPL
jgi:hypothetical protein